MFGKYIFLSFNFINQTAILSTSFDTKATLNTKSLPTVESIYIGVTQDDADHGDDADPVEAANSVT